MCKRIELKMVEIEKTFRLAAIHQLMERTSAINFWCHFEQSTSASWRTTPVRPL